jgi:hypothetical protein
VNTAKGIADGVKLGSVPIADVDRKLNVIRDLQKRRL